jgi:hypothetical protein
MILHRTGLTNLRKEDGVGGITMGDGTQEDLKEVADIMASEIKEKTTKNGYLSCFP